MQMTRKPGRPKTMGRPRDNSLQDELLSFIIAHVEQFGYQPSQNEMGEVFGISKATIRYRLEGLQKRGLLEMTGMERAMVIPSVSFKANETRDDNTNQG